MKKSELDRVLCLLSPAYKDKYKALERSRRALNKEWSNRKDFIKKLKNKKYDDLML